MHVSPVCSLDMLTQSLLWSMGKCCIKFYATIIHEQHDSDEKQNGCGKKQMGTTGSKMGRKFEQKRKAKWEKKQIWSRPSRHTVGSAFLLPSGLEARVLAIKVVSIPSVIHTPRVSTFCLPDVTAHDQSSQAFPLQSSVFVYVLQAIKYWTCSSLYYIPPSSYMEGEWEGGQREGG